ncbi:MAG: exonuclease domain-containing protein [Lachnospiraceae bacterium]|nr:exonuclease domain-containing protein [Lachnospiraceae bacterium]
MNYIVFDLEWNQSNMGGSSKVEGFPFEIIEIGAVKLNGDGIYSGEFNELVKPQVYKEMHRITGKLIHLTMDELKHSRSFPEVATRFEIWCGEEPFFYCTWGTLDLMELQRNRKFYHLSPLSEKPIAYLDIQKLFALTYDPENPRKRRALQDAVDHLKIEKHIPFHRAFSDAYYTAKVLQELLKNNPDILSHVSYDVFYPPRSREDEVKHQFDTYFKYISRVFPGKKELLSDREVSSSKCYLCHCNLKKKVRWFTTNNKHYLCLAKCEKHGYLKGKIRVNRTQEGEAFAVKTTKLVSESEAKAIIDRWEHILELKNKPAHAQKEGLYKEQRKKLAAMVEILQENGIEDNPPEDNQESNQKKV